MERAVKRSGGVEAAVKGDLRYGIFFLPHEQNRVFQSDDADVAGYAHIQA